MIGSQECDFSTNRTARSAIRAARSAIRAEIALLLTNQITGNTIDLKMNIIKHYILYIIKAINSSIVSICLWQLSIDNARFPWPCLLTCMSVTILFCYITLLHYIIHWETNAVLCDKPCIVCYIELYRKSYIEMKCIIKQLFMWYPEVSRSR